MAAAWLGAYLDAFRAEVNKAVSGPFQNRISPVEATGLGDFHWFWGDRDGFNPATFRFLSRRVAPGAYSGGSVRLVDSFPDAYARLLGSITFSLSRQDQARWDDLELRVSVCESTLLSAYKHAFGPITPADWEAAHQVAPQLQTELDYVVGYAAGCRWSCAERDGRPPLTEVAMRQAPSLAALLDCTPAEGAWVVKALGDYLAAAATLGALTDRVREWEWRVRTAQANTDSPAPGNGCMFLDPGEGVPPHAPVVGYTVERSVPDIYADLGKTDIAFSVDFDAERTDEQTVRLRIGTGPEVPAPLGFLTAARLGATAPLPLLAMPGAGPKARVQLTFTGISVIPVQPDPFSAKTGTGWYFPEAIAEAARNTGSGEQPTGYRFLSTSQPYDLPSFGQIRAVVVSRSPTISTSFSEGDVTQLAAQFEPESRWELSLANQGNLGVLEVQTHRAPDMRFHAEPGFHVVLAPAGASPGLRVRGPADEAAYVLGVVADYPGRVSLA